MAAVGILGSLGANAKLLPFNETYFPDAVVRQWLTDKYPSAISNGKIETDKVTSFSVLLKDYASNPYKEVVDLRCLRYFTKVTDSSISISNRNFTKLKYIDVSGLGIKSITNSISMNANKEDNNLMTAPVEEIIADSCVNLTTFTFNNCLTLARVSVKDCPKLTEFYSACKSTLSKFNTVLRTVDLSDSPNIEQVWVHHNPNLVELRLPHEGRVLPLDYQGKPYTAKPINIQFGYCAVEEIDLSDVYTTNSNKTITVNAAGNNMLRKIDFHQKTKPLNFQALTLLNNSLTSLEIPFEYGNGAYKVVTGQGSTQKRNVGPEDEVVICDTVMRGTVSNEKGGTVNKTLGVFTFNSPSTTTGSYTYKPLGNAGVAEKLTINVTLTRKKAMRMWVCGTFNGWTIDENGEWIKPSGWDDYENRKWELEYVSANDYKLRYNGNVSGDFRILVNDPNYTGDEATYWLGASHADLVTPYTAIGGEDFSRKATDDGNGSGKKIYDISSKPVSHYDTFHYVAHVKNEGKKLRVIKDSPYAFSTHPCQEAGQTTTHVNPLFHVSFVSGHRTSEAPDGGGGAGFDGGTVGVDVADADANAPEVWYNLQGERVNPDSHGGIFIVRQGSKVRKVMVP